MEELNNTVPLFFVMRYYYKPKKMFMSLYGQIYECDHPVYNRCTLYLIDDYGLAVIQQRYDATSKATYWTEIDPYLVDDLYLHERFLSYFKSKAGKRSATGLYPTVTIRQLMWALRVKPLPRCDWETVFDKSPI